MKTMTWMLLGILGLSIAAVGQDPPVGPGKADLAEILRGCRERNDALRDRIRADFKKLEELPEAEREAAGNKAYEAYESEARKLAAEVVAIAKENATALEAIETAFRMNVDEAMTSELLGLLSRHHLENPKVGTVLGSLAWCEDPAAGELLDGVLAKNPAKEARGFACYVLAQRAKKAADKEALLERCVKEFSDVKRGEETLGVVAQRELDASRNVKIGKVPPDIAGKDMDGVAFKLSDYRGKVIVLDFWGFW